MKDCISGRSHWIDFLDTFISSVSLPPLNQISYAFQIRHLQVHLVLEMGAAVDFEKHTFLAHKTVLSFPF